MIGLVVDVAQSLSIILLAFAVIQNTKHIRRK